jgi:hypothetical protein
VLTRRQKFKSPKDGMNMGSVNIVSVVKKKLLRTKLSIPCLNENNKSHRFKKIGERVLS